MEGAIAVYLAAAANAIADLLPLGSFEYALVGKPQGRLLVLSLPPFIVGLWLSPQASPALVRSEAMARLS